MKYTEYEPEHFLLDDSFIQYCMQNDTEAVRYWENWLELHPEHIEKVKNAKELYFLLNGNLRPAEFTRDKKTFEDAFAAINNVLPARTENRVVNVSFWNVQQRVIAVAAAIAIVAVCLIGFSVFNNKSNTVLPPSSERFSKESKPGERKSFQLADGTQVTLNAGSTLTISDDFNKNERHVILHGEAFFEVIHDKSKPFVIHTNDMDVRVLGTVFNVKAYDNDNKIETSLISGSVEVTLIREHNRKITLLPKEKIVYRKANFIDTSDSAKTENSIKPAAFNLYDVVALTHPEQDSVYNEVSWLDNRLSFSQEKLSDIVPELERWFNISIVISDSSVGEFRYTGTFKKKTVKQVLDALQLSKAFSYSIGNNQQIVISK